MDTACYYTFSTICQTLAGAFGFLVAVVIFRVQTIEGSQSIVFENSYSVIKHDSLPTPAKEKLLDAAGRVIERNQADLGRIKVGLRWSLYWTGGTIIGCLALLPTTPLLVLASSWLVWLVLVAAVASAIYTITTYAALVLELTRGEEQGPREGG
jgi:hypothetical protein